MHQLNNVFYRLRLIETYETGIQKIMQAYEKADQRPILEVTGNAFKITLPNRHFRPEHTQTEDEEAELYRDEWEQQVLQRFKEKDVLQGQRLRRSSKSVPLRQHVCCEEW